MNEAVRRQRIWLMVALAVVAVAVVAAAIAIGGADDGGGGTTGAPEGAAEARALFEGIPQRGIQLGARDAKVTVADFSDLQCPFCGESARDELPEVVKDYVRPGRVKLEFRVLAFIGPDSQRGARMALAASLQDRLWQFVDLVYRNQGDENSGWMTDAYMRRIAAAAGLDAKRALRARRSPEIDLLMTDSRAAARAAKVQSTPTYVISRGGRVVERVEGAGQLAEALEKVVSGGS